MKPTIKVTTYNNEQDNSSMDNFSIQDTMQMGMGNTVLDGL
jgi:hypothetical protein